MSERGYITQAGLCTDETNCTLKERACGNGTVPIGIKPISILTRSFLCPNLQRLLKKTYCSFVTKKCKKNVDKLLDNLLMLKKVQTI